MAITRTDVAKQILRTGAAGAMFQFREIREALGVGSDDPRAMARIHNDCKALHADGLMEQVSGDRTRNRFFRIADENALRLLANRGISDEQPAPRPTGGPERLVRLESKTERLSARIDQLEARLTAFIAAWS